MTLFYRRSQSKRSRTTVSIKRNQGVPLQVECLEAREVPAQVFAVTAPTTCVVPAMAVEPGPFPVEPDFPIGGPIAFPVEPDFPIGGPVALPVEPGSCPASNQLMNQPVLTNLQRVFAQPLPPQIALAQIVQVTDTNGDHAADVTALIGMPVRVRGRMAIQLFSLTFDGLSPGGALVGQPQVLGTF